MNIIALLSATCLAAGAALAQSSAPVLPSAPPTPPTPPAQSAPIVVSGLVADEASKAALLARLRQVFGPERVLDQLSVGAVSAPMNWDDVLNRLMVPNLKLIHHGQLSVQGTTVSLRGEVANEAQRQQITTGLGASLDPGYTLNNGLRVTASEQLLLDTALANRTIEFDSGRATLTESGRAILNQMSVAWLKLKDKKVALIGHTDNAGARASNLSLSQARAEAVKTYLSAKGIRPELLVVSGEGPDRPLADNRTADGRARNRRIEFNVEQ
ncbi:MAG: OmpA family protein [Massilia sp.]|nr:OmpA family protein [Massilia sp.]